MQIAQSPIRMFLVTTLAVVVAGCGQQTGQPNAETLRKQEPLVPSAPQPAPQPAPAVKSYREVVLATKPDFVLKEKEFMAEWEKDETLAITKYMGKFVDVTGDVRQYIPNFSDGLPALACSTTFPYICEETDALAKVAPGQTVTLRTKLQPGRGWRDWVIVKVEGPPPQELTADELAKAFAADAEGAKKKYGGKYVRLSGKMGEMQSKGPLVNVVLSSPEIKPNIVCEFEYNAIKQAREKRGLVKGDAVRVLAECSNIEDAKLHYPAVLPRVGALHFVVRALSTLSR